MKTVSILAWLLFGLEAIFVATLFVQRNMGDDAAGRGLARGWATVLAPILLVAGALVWWGRHADVKPAFWIGFLILASPVLIGAAGGVRETLRSIDRARGRAQYGRFTDPKLTEIARAIDRHDLAKTRTLLAAGPVDFAARDRCDHTLLGHAVMRVLETYGPDSGADGVRALLDAGAVVDRRALATERTSYAPEDYELIAAVYGGNSPGAIALLDLLLGAGADPNASDMFDEPIIFSTYGTIPKLEVLARHGADLTRLHTRSDRLGWTGAMNAASMGDWEQVQFFLDHGVRAEHAAPDGQTLASILDTWAEQTRQSGGRPELDEGYRRLRERLDPGGASR